MIHLRWFSKPLGGPLRAGILQPHARSLVVRGCYHPGRTAGGELRELHLCSPSLASLPELHLPVRSAAPLESHGSTNQPVNCALEGWSYMLLMRNIPKPSFRPACRKIVFHDTGSEKTGGHALEQSPGLQIRGGIQMRLSNHFSDNADGDTAGPRTAL